MWFQILSNQNNVTGVYEQFIAYQVNSFFKTLTAEEIIRVFEKDIIFNYPTLEYKIFHIQ